MRSSQKSARLSQGKSDKELRTIWLAERGTKWDDEYNWCGYCEEQFPCGCEFKEWKKQMTWEKHDEIITKPAIDKTSIRFCTQCGSSKIDKYCGSCGVLIKK